MKYRLPILAGLILWLSIGNTAYAEQETAPLLILISEYPHQGNLWAWTAPDQPLKQLTTWGYNYFPVIAPDGKSVAYDAVPPDFTKDQCCGWPPANIGIVNLETGKNTQIVAQPPDIAKGVTHRPQPAWSPDSKSLAWGEIPRYNVESDGTLTGFDSYQLVAYELDTQRWHVVVPNMPGVNGLVDGTVVDWSTTGFTFYGSSGNAPTIYIYSADGKLLVQQALRAYNPCVDEPVLRATWVTDHNRLYVHFFGDCSKPSPDEFLIDPVTGHVSQTSGVLERYSPSAPDGMSLFSTRVDDKAQPIWNLVIPGKSPVQLDIDTTYYSAVGLVAIAPDGRRVAYLSHDALMLYDSDGQIRTVGIKLKENQDIEWIGWGPVGWRIRHT